MKNLAIIEFKNIEIGIVTNITMDMGYLEGIWYSNQSEQALNFEGIVSKNIVKDIFESPLKGTLAKIRFSDSNANGQYVLIISLEESMLFMRLINEETAAYADLSILEPWQKVVNPTAYEKKLKKEISFFHPLNWKKLRAIGIRKDRDDVLFEILSKSNAYAIVHLTHSKESFRKFPVIKFYKNWNILYNSRLIIDNKEWIENP